MHLRCLADRTTATITIASVVATIVAIDDGSSSITVIASPLHDFSTDVDDMLLVGCVYIRIVDDVLLVGCVYSRIVDDDDVVVVIVIVGLIVVVVVVFING